MDNTLPGQENPAAPIKNIDVTYDADTPLEDIQAKYTQIGSDYNQFVENSYNNVQARQAEHIGNDFGGSPYNYHTYYEPGASGFASAMRQTGTQEAFKVGMERGKAEAEANLEAAKNNYSNAVSAYNTMAEQYNQTKGDPLVSTVDESLLPEGVTAEEFANYLNTSDDPYQAATNLVNAKDLTGWVKDWNVDEIRRIANKVTGNSSEELKEAWERAKAAGQDSDEWNQYFARTDVSRIWSDAYAAEWARRNVGDAFAARWEQQASTIKQLGQAIVDTKNGTFDWATQTLIPQDKLPADLSSALDINIIDVAMNGDLQSLNFENANEVTQDYDIKLLNKDEIYVNGEKYTADQISELISKNVGVKWSWLDLMQGKVSDAYGKKTVAGSDKRDPETNTKNTKALIQAAFSKDTSGLLKDSMTFEPTMSMRGAFQAATGVSPEEFQSIYKLKSENPEAFNKLTRSVSSALADASIFELADGDTEYHTADGWIKPAKGTVVLNTVDAMLDANGKVKDKDLQKLVEIYGSIDDPMTMDADTEKAYKEAWTGYVQNLALYKILSAQLDKNIGRDLYNAILYKGDPSEDDYTALTIGGKSIKDFVSEFKSLAATDRAKAQELFASYLQQGMSTVGYYMVQTDEGVATRSLKTERGESTIGRQGVDNNAYSDVAPDEALAAAIIISTSIDQFNKNKDQDININPEFLNATAGENLYHAFQKTIREIGKDIEMFSGLFGGLAAMGKDAIWGGNTADKEALKIAAKQGDFSAYMKELMKDWKTINIVGDSNMSELFFGDYDPEDYGYKTEMQYRMQQNLRDAVNPLVDAVWFGNGDVTAFGDKSRTKQAAIDFVLLGLVPIGAAGVIENGALGLLDTAVTSASKKIMAGGIKRAKNTTTVALSSSPADDIIETYVQNAATDGTKAATSVDDLVEETDLLKPGDIGSLADDTAKTTVNTVKATGYEDLLDIATVGATKGLNSYYDDIVNFSSASTYQAMGDIIAQRLVNEVSSSEFKTLVQNMGFDVTDNAAVKMMFDSAKQNANAVGAVIAESAYQRATVAAFTGQTVENVAMAGKDVQQLAFDIAAESFQGGHGKLASNFIRDMGATGTMDDVSRMLSKVIDDSALSFQAGRGAWTQKEAIRSLAANGWTVQRNSLLAKRLAKTLAQNTVEDTIRGYIKPTLGPEGETERTTAGDYFSNPANFVTPVVLSALGLGAGAVIRRVQATRLATKVDKAQAALTATSKADPTYPAKLQKLLDYSDKANRLTNKMLDRSLSYNRMKEVSDEASDYLRREIDGFFDGQGFNMEPVLKNTTLSKNYDFQKYVAKRMKATDVLFQAKNITEEQAMAKVGFVRSILHMDDNMVGSLGKISDRATQIKFWKTLNDVANDESLIKSVKDNVRLKSFESKNAAVRAAQVEAVVKAFSTDTGGSIIPGLRESTESMLKFFDDIGADMIKKGTVKTEDLVLGYIPTAAFHIGSPDDGVPAAARGIWVNTSVQGLDFTTPDPTAHRAVSLGEILDAFSRGENFVEKEVDGAVKRIEFNSQGLDPFTATMAYYNTVNLHYNTGKIFGDAKTSVGAAALKGNYAVVGGEKAAAAAAGVDLKANKARQDEINKILKERTSAADAARIKQEVAEGKKMERLLKNKESLTTKLADAKAKVGQQEATIARIQQELADGRKPSGMRATVGEVLGVKDDSALVSKAKAQIEADIRAVQAGEDLSGIAANAGRVVSGQEENPYFAQIVKLQNSKNVTPDMKEKIAELSKQSTAWDQAHAALDQGKVKTTKADNAASVINSFRGDNDFLSNFYAAKVTYEGVDYPTAEHAFQAAKSTDPEVREIIKNAVSPANARAAGKRIKLRSDWEQVKTQVMKDIIESKFSQNPELMAKLKATGAAVLSEGNTWGDTFWGVDAKTGKGENNLGKILMELRGNGTETPVTSTASQTVRRSSTYLEMINEAARNGGNYDYDLVVRRAIEDYDFSPVMYERGNISGVENTLDIKPTNNEDMKAAVKGRLSNKFIGFSDGITGSSTGNYAKQAGNMANTGSYANGDVVFMSVVGNRGTDAARKANWDKTVQEAKLALDNGAVVVADNADYIKASEYNIGEAYVADKLRASGYAYTDIQAQGQRLGVWYSKDQAAPKFVFENEVVFTDVDELGNVKDYTRRQLSYIKPGDTKDAVRVRALLDADTGMTSAQESKILSEAIATAETYLDDAKDETNGFGALLTKIDEELPDKELFKQAQSNGLMRQLTSLSNDGMNQQDLVRAIGDQLAITSTNDPKYNDLLIAYDFASDMYSQRAAGAGGYTLGKVSDYVDFGDDEDLSDLAQNNVVTDLWGNTVDEGADMQNLTTNRLMEQDNQTSIPKMLRQYVVDVEDREQMKNAIESFTKVVTGLTDENSPFYDSQFARAKASRRDILSMFKNARKDFSKSISELAKTDTETRQLVSRATSGRQTRQAKIGKGSSKVSSEDYLAALGIARSSAIISKSKNPTQYAAAAAAFDNADSESLVSKIKNIAAISEEYGFAPTTLAYMRQNVDGIYGDDVNSMINYMAGTPQGMYRQYRAALGYLEEKGVDTTNLKKELASIADALGLRGGIKYNDDLAYSNEQTLDQEFSTFLTEIPNKSSWLNKLQGVVDYSASEYVRPGLTSSWTPQDASEFKALMQSETAYHSGSFYDMYTAAKDADAEVNEAMSGSPVKMTRDADGQFEFYDQTPAELQEQAWIDYLSKTPEMSDDTLEAQLKKATETLESNKKKVAEIEAASQELEDGTKTSVKKANNKSKAQKSVEKILGKELYKELEDLKAEEKTIRDFLKNKTGVYHAKNGTAYVGSQKIMSNYVRLEDARTALGATPEGFVANTDDKAARKAMIKELKKGNLASSNRVGSNLASSEKLDEAGLLNFKPKEMDNKSKQMTLSMLTGLSNDINKYLDNTFIDANQIYVDKSYLDLMVRFSDKPLSGTSKMANLASMLANFSQEVQNFQLAGGWGAYNALTLAQLRSAILENPAKAREFIKMLGDVRNMKSSMQAVQGNIDLLTEMAYKMNDSTVTMDLATIMSNRPDRNDGGVLQSFVSKSLDKRDGLSDKYPKGFKATLQADVDMLFEDPTFQQAIPVIKAQMYAMNYDAARSNIEKRFQKELVSGAMSYAEAHDAAIELAYVQTQKFWSPEKFWRTQFDNSAALERIHNQNLRRFIGTNITGEGTPTTATELASNAFFALRYKQTFVNRAAQGASAIPNALKTALGRAGDLDDYVNAASGTKLATSVGSLMGLGVLAAVWCEAVGVPTAWDDFTYEPQGDELIHIPSVLQKIQTIGQIWLPNDTREDGTPYVNPNKRAIKLDPMFSMWTLPNTVMRAVNKTLNSQTDDYAAPQRGLPFIGTNNIVNKAVNSNFGRAVTDEMIGSNLLSPLKAIHEVLTNSTYYGNNIWERKYLPDGKENPNYDPSRNVTASIFHLMGWDEKLDPNGYNTWVKGGENRVKQDQIGTVSGSGILQHEYWTAIKKMMEGDYASAIVEAGELPFKFQTLSSTARTELNTVVKNTLAHYGTQYKAAIKNARNNDAKDEAYAAYVKKSADAVAQWSAKYDYILGENQDLVAYATRMLMAMTAGEYDDNMAYLQNAYWKATQIAQIESTENLFFKDDDLDAWIAEGGTAEDFYKEKNRRSDAYNQALDDEWEARQALRKAGYSEEQLADYAYEDLRSAQRTASNKVYTEIQGKLSSRKGEFDNFKDMKSYYEELIDDASTTNQKVKLAQKYNQEFFDVIAPYVDQYGASLLTDTKVNGTGIPQNLAEYVIIPADQKYYGKTPKANYIKDYFGVGYRNKTNLPSDDEVVKKFSRAMEMANSGKTAAASSVLESLVKRINSGDTYASDEDYNRIIRLKALTTRRK